jgi:hypothetical protein
MGVLGHWRGLQVGQVFLAEQNHFVFSFGEEKYSVAKN